MVRDLIISVLAFVGSVHAADPRIEAVTKPKVEFLAEQDGVPERELKARLAIVFSDYPDVRSAYLVIVGYPEIKTRGVALCIRAVGGPDKALVSAVSKVFHMMFSAQTALDIMFISSDEESRLSAVAKPFYARS